MISPGIAGEEEIVTEHPQSEDVDAFLNCCVLRRRIWMWRASRGDSGLRVTSRRSVHLHSMFHWVDLGAVGPSAGSNALLGHGLVVAAQDFLRHVGFHQ